MRIEACSFCGSKVYAGHCVMFVRNDCKIIRFCRSKCRRSYNKKKNPLRTRWTKAYREAHGKDLVNDPTQKIETRRNELPKYNRERWMRILESLKRIQVIRTRRSEMHIHQRLKKGAENRKAADIREVQVNLNLYKAVNAPGRKEIEDQLSAVLQARAQQQVRPRVRVTEDPDEDMQRTVEPTSASLTSTALAPIAEPMAIEVDDD